MKLNFLVTTALMAYSELAAAGAVGIISARDDAVPAQQWLKTSCRPLRDPDTKGTCGSSFVVNRESCQNQCQCVRSSDPNQIADQIRCTAVGSCDTKKLEAICTCTGEAGSGACGNGGFGLG